VTQLIKWGASSVDRALEQASKNNACGAARVLLAARASSYRDHTLLDAAAGAGAIDALKLIYDWYCTHSPDGAKLAQQSGGLLDSAFQAAATHCQYKSADLIRSWHPGVDLERALLAVARSDRPGMMETLANWGATNLNGALSAAADASGLKTMAEAVRLGATNVASVLKRIHGRCGRDMERVLIDGLAAREGQVG
jgi:hypothetical protein